MASRPATKDPVADGTEPTSTHATSETNPGVQIDMSALVALLTSMDEKIDAQGAEIQRLKTERTHPNVSTMRPMDATIQPRVGAEASPVLHGPGEGIDNTRVLPHGVDSHELPDAALISYERLFDAGDPVFIRPDVQRKDCPKSWGEILESAGTNGVIRCNVKSRRFQRGCPGTLRVGDICPTCHVGPTVRKVHFLNPDGQWIYTVWVNGLTNPQGQMFEQRELEAAY
jgi:hypothetical protein